MEHSLNGEDYILNLIDTPEDHVDFSYEVSRSIARVKEALIVDAVRNSSINNI